MAYLRITDGTTEFNLLSNEIDLIVQSWAPNVATRRRGGLGGDPYTTVVERIPLYVSSTTDAATLLSNLDNLAALIEQAGRWWNGESVDAVTVQYSPNSSSTYVEAAILGPPPGEPAIVLPPSFMDYLDSGTAVVGIWLQFERRGLWLGDIETVTSGTPSSHVNTINLTDINNLSPCDFDLSINIDADFGGFIAIAPQNGLKILEAESGSFLYFSSVSDSNASGGNVAEHNGTSSPAGYIEISGISILDVNRYHVFASLKNPAAGKDYTISGLSKNTIIPAGANNRGLPDNPTIMYLGQKVLNSQQTLTSLKIYAQPDGTPSAGNRLQIDYFILVADTDSTIILQSDFYYRISGSETVRNKHLSLSDTNPTYYRDLGTSNSFISYTGTIPLFSNSAQDFILAVYGIGIDAYWMTDSTTHTVTIKRQEGFLVPQ